MKHIKMKKHLLKYHYFQQYNFLAFYFFLNQNTKICEISQTNVTIMNTRIPTQTKPLKDKSVVSNQDLLCSHDCLELSSIFHAN